MKTKIIGQSNSMLDGTINITGYSRVIEWDSTTLKKEKEYEENFKKLIKEIKNKSNCSTL